MPRNYNTTNGLPYIRVNQLVINYNSSDAERAVISFTENEALLDANSNINILQGFADGANKTLSLSEIATEQFDIINVDTGEPTGATMALVDLYVAITSYVRKIQLAEESLRKSREALK